MLACAVALGFTLASCAGTPSSGPVRDPRAAHTRAARSAFEHGTALLQRGDTLRAEQYLLLAARYGYPEAEVLPALVHGCIASSRLRAALDHALPYLKRHPEAWQLRYLVAAIQLALGHADIALSELHVILDAHPDAAGPSYLAGVIERDQRHDERAARASFAAYLRAQPTGEHAAEVAAWMARRSPSPRPQSESAP